MLEKSDGHRGDFHARIREVEKGLYLAEYTGELNPDNPDQREWADSHLATSLDDANVFVENLARTENYRRVVWESLPE
jgi:hypothetical protein